MLSNGERLSLCVILYGCGRLGAGWFWSILALFFLFLFLCNPAQEQPK